MKSKMTLFVISLLSSHYAFAHTSTLYDWTGFYAGLNIGALQHTLNMTDNLATTFNATIQQNANPALTGGLQAGYRRSLSRAATSGLYGVEFTANFASAKFHSNYGSPYALYQLETYNKLENTLLLEVMGGIAIDNTLLFIAAGPAWSQISGQVINIDGAPFYDSFSLSKTAFGPAVSAGIENVIYRNLTARFKVDFIMPNTYTTHNNTNDPFGISNTVVQGTLGINYKFA